jgi:hypothetical protein
VYSDRNPPRQCPHGHPFGPNKVLVGWDNLRRPPCRSWTCRTCLDVVYATPPDRPSAIHPRGL